MVRGSVRLIVSFVASLGLEEYSVLSSLRRGVRGCGSGVRGLFFFCLGLVGFGVRSFREYYICIGFFGIFLILM